MLNFLLNEELNMMVSILLLPVNHYKNFCIANAALSLVLRSLTTSQYFPLYSPLPRRVVTFLFLNIGKNRRNKNESIHLHKYLLIIIYRQFFLKLHSHCKMTSCYCKVNPLQSEAFESDIVFSYQIFFICISKELKQFSFSLVSF